MGGGTAAKGKIQRLLRDLERSESGGVDAALAAASTSAEFDEVVARIQEGSSVRPTSPPLVLPSVPALEGEDEDDTSTTVTDDTDQAPVISRARAGHRYQGSDRLAYLEHKMLQLMADNKALALNLEHVTRQKDLHVAELQSQLDSAMRDLQARQREVEAAAPLVRLRLEDFRAQLRDLRVSDARYAELKALPAANLHALDEVKVAVYEETAKLRKENERLRLGIAGAREAAGRAEDEAARLRMDHSRMSAALVEKEKDCAQATDTLKARVERLASELEAAVVRAELLAAKGQMYDEVKKRADDLGAEVQRLQVVEVGFKRLEARAQDLELMARDKAHTHEMLVTDKAYLSQQVEFLQDALRRLQSEVEVKEAKVAELQKQRQELFDKLVQTETGRSRQEESRLQRELAGLQATTAASVERIRVDTAEAYEREARLLRQLRDAAQEEAAAAKQALADQQGVAEEQQLVAAQVQRKLDATILELQGELKQKAFELSHLHVVLGEKEALLQRAHIQNEALQEKLQASLDQFRALEADVRAAAAAGLPLSATVTALALPPPSATHPAGAAGPAAGSAVPPALVAELRTRVRTLEREKQELAAQVSGLQAALKASRASLSLAGQPHAFLLDQLQSAKVAAQQAEMQALAATTALKAKEQEAAAAVSERDAVRADLEQLLQQRGQLEGVKALLMKVVGGGLPQVPAAATAPPRRPGTTTGSLVPPPPQLPLTTIIGLGP